MYSKNPYGVPYSEMVVGAKFYDVWREEWVVLEKPYDNSYKSYWFIKSCGINDEFRRLSHLTHANGRQLSHLDDLAYDVVNEEDTV